MHHRVSPAVCALFLAACTPRLAPHPDLEPNAVRLLVDRDQVFPAVLEAIRGAREEVLLSMYLWGGVEAPPGTHDGIGREMVDLLVEKQRQGVRVRILNTRFVEVDDPRTPEEKGPDDPWFHPVFDLAQSRGLPILRPAPGKGGADHTKYMVVDGHHAIFGGMNLADSVGSNHDSMVHAVGPVAWQLQQVFNVAWDAALKKNGPTAKPLVGPVAVAQPVERVLHAREAAIAQGYSRCAIRLRTNTPDAQSIHPLIMEYVQGAARGERLDIALLLFSERKLLDAVMAAHARGVAVRVMLDPNEAFFGMNCQAAHNAEVVARLADAGVPVRFYDVHKGQELHMKVLVYTRANGERVFASGSANWTERDMFQNWEVTAVFERCQPEADRFAATFETDWNTRTRVPSAEQLAVFRDPAGRGALSAACGKALGRAWLRGAR